MCYKCSNNLVTLPSDEYFGQQHQVSQTRYGGNKLIAPLCSNNHFKNDFFNRCLNCYKNLRYLPAHVVNANSVFTFEKLLNNTDLYVYLHCKYFLLCCIIFMLSRYKWHLVCPAMGSWNHTGVFVFIT